MRRFDRLLLFPLLCPAALLLAANDGFGFDPPGFTDAFMYLGYFWHYPEHLWLFDDPVNYKISRLPWLLPGFVAHTLLAPIPAARVLAYCTLASAAVALYLHVRDTLRDRYAAAFASTMFACCTPLHGPGGWYYHTLAATGYYLWSCWLMTRAATAERRRAAWAATARACFAAAVHTHLFLMVFAPLLALLYWGALNAYENQRSPRWVTTTASVVAGGVGLTALLAVVNRITGGVVFFFLPQLQIALKLARHDDWWRPAAQWLPDATYLVLPIAMIAAGLSTGYRVWKRSERPAGTLVLLPCVALALTCVFQFWRHVTTLDYDYMAFVLFPHAVAAGATAVWAFRPAASDASRHPRGVLAISAAVILAPLLLLMPTTLPTLMNEAAARVGLAHVARIVPPLLFSLAGVIVTRIAPRAVQWAVIAVWFSIVNAWIAPQPAAYGVGTPGTRQEMLETFRDADEFAHRLDPSLVGIKYWISSENLTTPYGLLQSQQVFDSFVGTRAWLTNLFGRTSPGLPIEQLTLEHLERASCIGILSSRDQQAALAHAMMAHYASLERPLQVLAERRFERSEFGFALTVLRPGAGTDQAGGSAPPCMTTDPRLDQRGRERSDSTGK